MKQMCFILNTALQGDVVSLYSKGPQMTDKEYSAWLFLDVYTAPLVCSPPPLNSAPCVGVALAAGNDGAGVCARAKKSNLDKGDVNIVRKGLIVDYMGLRVWVQRVRLGMFYGKTLSGNPVNFPCAWVRVVG